MYAQKALEFIQRSDELIFSQQDFNNQIENSSTFRNEIINNESNTYNDIKQQTYSNEIFLLQKKLKDRKNENKIMLPDSVELIYNSVNKSNDIYQNNQNSIDNYYKQYEFQDHIQFNNAYQNQEQNYQNQNHKIEYNDSYYSDKNQFYLSYNGNSSKLNNSDDNGGAGGRCCTPVDPSMLIDDKKLNNFFISNNYSNSAITDMKINTTITTNSTISGSGDDFEVKKIIKF